MLRPIDNYFLQQEEPIRGCLQFLRQYILKLNKAITEKWRYGMPFYYYKDKRICYLWIHRKKKQPYLGIVEGRSINHTGLVLEKRAKMKILLIDADKNVPVATIKTILHKAILLCN